MAGLTSTELGSQGIWTRRAPSPVDRYEDARLCTPSMTCSARVPQPPRGPLRLPTRTAIAGAMSSLLIPSGEPVLVFGERYA